MPKLEDNFVEIVGEHMAGDPMREDVVWTYLTAPQIASELAECGTPVCADTVRKLLDEHDFHQRQAEKTKTKADVPQRNEQFENIARLKREYQQWGQPIISMDSKKKEFIGDLFRDGRAYANGPNPVLDHDYPSWALGKLVPHGLYDLQRNVGHITLGFSHDTSQFACDSFRLWWRRWGARAYPRATSILLLCDGGGSNNCRHQIFKEDLQRLASALGVLIRVAHYPPYCSKYNPIEHRLFPHVTRAWSGLIFRTLDIVTAGLARVATSTGLKLTYTVLDKVYALQRTVSGTFASTNSIRFDKYLPQWNYVVEPA
jgi:hypothetical protein